MFYVYILESKKKNDLYIGYSADLRKRVVEHNRGLSFSTKNKIPLKLIYYEACLNKNDAKRIKLTKVEDY